MIIRVWGQRVVAAYDEREQPDVYLIGDTHTVAEHADLSLQLVKEIAPEYVIDEEHRANSQFDEVLDNYLTLYEAASVFAEKYREDIFAESPKEVLQYAKEAFTYEHTEGQVIPDVEELVTTPVYELHPYILKGVEKSLERKADQLSSENPEASDFLRNIQDHYQSTWSITSSQSESISRLQHYMRQELGRGDIEGYLPGGPKMKSVSSPVYRVPARFSPIIEDTPEFSQEAQRVFRDRVDEIREKNFADTIATYTDQSEKPIVALFGAAHLNDDATLLDELEKEHISYRRVFLDPEEPFSKTVEEYLTDEDSSKPNFSEEMKQLAEKEGITL